MSIKERYFFIGDQWSVIHLPSKPNGFAIVILGDVNHYVQSNKNFWYQHPERKVFIEKLTNSGYTVFYSNLYGRNWGSDDACELFVRLYDEVMRREILNRKVHVIAEGMGALVAAKVLSRKQRPFRSFVLINPCINLLAYFQTEKKNRLFYKRFMKELTQAYRCSDDVMEAYLQSLSKSFFEPINTPTKILHCIHQTPYTMDQHVRPYEQMLKNHNVPVEVSIFLPDKSFSQLFNPITTFLEQQEKSL